MTYWSGNVLIIVSASQLALLILLVSVLLALVVAGGWLAVRAIHSIGKRLQDTRQDLDHIKHQVVMIQTLQDTRIAERLLRPRQDQQRFLTLTEEDYEAYQGMEDQMYGLLASFPDADDDIPEREQLL